MNSETDGRLDDAEPLSKHVGAHVTESMWERVREEALARSTASSGRRVTQSDILREALREFLEDE